MGFGWLKKLGQKIAEGQAVVDVFSPAIKLAIPGDKDDKVLDQISSVSKDLTMIANVVVDVEAASNIVAMTGEQKLAVATPKVIQILLTSSMMAGKEVQDADLVRQGAADIAQGMVKFLNGIKKKE